MDKVEILYGCCAVKCESTLTLGEGEGEGEGTCVIWEVPVWRWCSGTGTRGRRRYERERKRTGREEVRERKSSLKNTEAGNEAQIMS